jgi:hypothetical protein
MATHDAVEYAGLTDPRYQNSAHTASGWPSVLSRQGIWEWVAAIARFWPRSVETEAPEHMRAYRGPMVIIRIRVMRVCMRLCRWTG